MLLTDDIVQGGQTRWLARERVLRFFQDGKAGLAASKLGQPSITRTRGGKALHPSGKAVRDGGIGAAGVAVPDQSSRTVETVDRNLHEENESTA
jgi:hypothetical protein